MLGCCSLQSLAVTCRPFRQRANQGFSTLVFVAAEGRSDSIHVETMRLADGFSNLVQVVNDRVSAFHEVLPDGSSSGVQIMGGAKPEERHVASMVPRIVALARCLQFHVNR